MGEIIGGELHAHPRPAGPHPVSCTSLASEIHSPYQKGRGGPGGWWLVVEPEVHFVRDMEVVVPDIAGLRRERMPRIPEDQRFEVVPDWVCEILSPSTAKRDRVIKMPVYARRGVAYLWLVDPLAKTLETFALDQGAGWSRDSSRTRTWPGSRPSTSWIWSSKPSGRTGCHSPARRREPIGMPPRAAPQPAGCSPAGWRWSWGPHRRVLA